ncbi:MAG TPA: DUF1028 domain-containing protein [Egibacteraceae bacterium]|nr:DUF1028 domain-containing protein [Egibacteraceae bacterium]
MTFSIVARDPGTGQLAVGAVTAMVGVGKLVPHARARVGAVATQATINPYLAYHGLQHLDRGDDALTALQRVLDADPGRDFRQCGIVDAAGGVAAWTGDQTPDWSGHITDSDVTVQGNRLVGRETLEAVLSTFHQRDDLDLAWRILEALQAGEETGADKKGALSGAITVVDTEDYALWDVRVDHADDPVAGLRSLMEEFEEQLLPQVRKLSTRDDQEGPLAREQGASIA